MKLLRKSTTSLHESAGGQPIVTICPCVVSDLLHPKAIAVHGTYWHNDYGRPRSHGCVNVLSMWRSLRFAGQSPAVPYDHIRSSSSARRHQGRGRIIVSSRGSGRISEDLTEDDRNSPYSCLILTDHEFQVPIDYSPADGARLTVLRGAVVRRTKPRLIYPGWSSFRWTRL